MTEKCPCPHSKVETVFPIPNYTTEIRKLSKRFISDTKVRKRRKRGWKRKDRLKHLLEKERELVKACLAGLENMFGKQVKNP